MSATAPRTYTSAPGPTGTSAPGPPGMSVCDPGSPGWSAQSALPDPLIITTPGGTSLTVQQPVDEGRDSIGELSVPSPGLQHADNIDMDMATIPIFYIDPHITEFLVYGFCADSMCFSCKTY